MDYDYQEFEALDGKDGAYYPSGVSWLLLFLVGFWCPFSLLGAKDNLAPLGFFFKGTDPILGGSAA